MRCWQRAGDWQWLWEFLVQESKAPMESPSLFGAYVAQQSARLLYMQAAASKRIADAGQRMRLASLAKLDRSFADAGGLQVGVRVLCRCSSCQTCGGCSSRRSWARRCPSIASSEFFLVTGVVREHGRALYNVRCSECVGDADPRPALVSGVWHNCRVLCVPLSDAFSSTCPQAHSRPWGSCILAGYCGCEKIAACLSALSYIEYRVKVSRFVYVCIRRFRELSSKEMQVKHRRGQLEGG